MEKNIKWNEGDGNIITISSGSGDSSIPFSSNENIGIDRQQEVNITTKEGIKAILTVKQPGLREVFITSNGESFMCADGNSFNVLK